MARIAGVKKIAIAEFKDGAKLDGTAADISAIEYDTVTVLPHLISFSGSENRSSSAWYSDDLVEETFENIVDYDLEFVLGHLDDAVRAKIEGSTVASGKKRVIVGANDVQKPVALIVELAQLGEGKAGSLFQVYYNCKLSVSAIEGETQTDSITDSPVTVSGKAIPLPTVAGEIMAEADSYDSNASSINSTAWFTRPQGSKSSSVLNVK